MPARPRHPMPTDVRRALDDRELMDDYMARPPYQQNDYVAWIDRARRPATRAARIAQMLDELERGGVYMKMEHPPSAKS